MTVLWPEVREVKDPACRAHAFTDPETGRTVIEVDEKLRGRERSAAIIAAWREHERGLPALIALPLLFIWDPFKRWASDHPAAAVAAGAAYGGALALSITAVIPALVDGVDRPSAVPAPVTVTAQAPPSLSGTPAWSPTRTPRTSATARGDRPEPIGLPTRQAPVSRPTRKPATTRPTRVPTSDAPAPEASPERSRPTVAAVETKEPAPVRTPPPSRTPVSAPASTQASAQPQAPPSGDCLLQVDVNPLLDVCILG